MDSMWDTQADAPSFRRRDDRKSTEFRKEPTVGRPRVIIELNHLDCMYTIRSLEMFIPVWITWYSGESEDADMAMGEEGGGVTLLEGSARLVPERNEDG